MRGFKDSPIPDASETPPRSFPEALVIPGFPARPELVPVSAPEIADVATPQLSSFKITKVVGTVHGISLTTATPTQPARFSQRYLFPSSRNLNVISVDII